MLSLFSLHPTKLIMPQNYTYSKIRKAITISFLLMLSTTLSYSQAGKLKKTELFCIPTAKFNNAASGYSFKVAIDSKENIAFNACSLPCIFIYNAKGEQLDSIKLPFTSCIRNLEFDENDNLLIMDNDELSIYQYDAEHKKLEYHPYQKPEDWFNLMNHYYKSFEISTIPTYYSNNDYLQDFYFTRFNYSYNLYFNYKNGYIYQCHYNFIKKIENHKMYSNQKKGNYWLSDNISIRSKILKIDDENKTVIYYDRFYNLIFEDFINGTIIVNPALEPNSEAARFDYSTNKNQDRIFGISAFNKQTIVISSWE